MREEYEVEERVESPKAVFLASFLLPGLKLPLGMMIWQHTACATCEFTHSSLAIRCLLMVPSSFLSAGLQIFTFTSKSCEFESFVFSELFSPFLLPLLLVLLS